MAENPNHPIQNISDTALWVAAYRAIESERPDALFSDPLARSLAGERGAQMVRSFLGGEKMAWVMAVRTKVIDEMILRAVENEGVRRVINLACGLDTRPYRLPLPADLHWIEADLPSLVQYKQSKIGGRQPRCRLDRVEVDLADERARRRFLAQPSEAKTLVLTEGLLCYLTETQAVELVRDLRASPEFNIWITDLFSQELVKTLRRSPTGRTLAKAGAPIFFGPRGGPDFFEAFGWRPRAVASILDEGRRLRRELPGGWIWHPLLRLTPRRLQNYLRQMYVIAQFDRA